MVYSNPRKLLLTSVGVIALTYISTCLFLFVRQPYLIFRPTPKILTLPSSPDFLLPYKDVRLPIAGSNEYIHGWWIPAPLPKEKVSLIPKGKHVQIYQPGSNSYLQAIQKFIQKIESQE